MPHPMSFTAVALVGALLAAPLAAQSVNQDVLCFMVSNVFVKSEKDPAKNQVAVASSFYFLGRVDTRLSTAQLKAAIAAQSKSVTAANVGQTMTACATRLRDKEVALRGAPAAAPQ